MKMLSEMTPYEFLCNQSWCTDDLKADITPDLADAFNNYIENVFDGQTPDMTELNDFMRFNYDDIIDNLGIASDDDINDDEV